MRVSFIDIRERTITRVHSFEIEDIHSEARQENETRTEVLREESFTDDHDLRRRELSCKLRPILRLMKLTGGYYGDTSLEEFPQVNSSISRIYCVIVLLASDFGGISKRRVYTLLAFTCCAVIFNSFCLAALDFYGDTSIARFQPWNGLLVYRLIHLMFSAFNCFTWISPVVVFGVSCSLLSGMFENLQTKISTKNPSSLNIGSLREEHQKIYETVAFADKVFSPYLFVVMSLHIPLICFYFHQLVKSKSSSEDYVLYITTVCYWWMGTSAELALILVLGTRVNEKIHSFYDTLHKISVPDCKEHLELLHFLMHLRGEPIGLSVGGLVVINKSLALSIVGIVMSYLAVLLTLPT
ncbi:uncharacterized protein LOC144656320 [Oculina patagonica]